MRIRLADIPAVLPALLPLGAALLILAGCGQPDADPASPATPSADTMPPPAGTDAGGASAPAADNGHVTVAWNCDGKPVAADYDNRRQEVRLQVGPELLTLPAAVSASGARYADAAGNEFWEHQGESTLTLAGGKAQACTKAAPAGS
ncbi:MliC family protein [Stenotrophomonas sp. HITSZ_GD]|uniref:MliC family protein n=1 Tax=Stenotrophomonas sp. HITSZ_GD TaxID=3037248 RepID=UPI00240E4E26|nr:MliC family protein [Stenotrophomonas sp. HITSZ_GD]MDG2525192.1 MliC family protein [Stenotrophomonas sp. HITSZ_GD]